MIRLVLIAMVLVSGLYAQEQKLNLNGAPSSDRFAVTDRVWPDTHGAGDVCLWYGDRMSAVSLTIDDNSLPDHWWWAEMTEKYGFMATWFIIVHYIQRENSPSFSGTWDYWRAWADSGFEVQSHTFSHGHCGTDGCGPPCCDINFEYGDAIDTIDAELNDHTTLTMAYSGHNQANSYYHSPDTAAKYYIAARSTSGTPNKANRTDYMSTGTGSIDIESVRQLTDDPSYAYWRGWIVELFHGVASHNADSVTKASQYAATEARIAYMAGRKDDIWLETFTKVAMYGQSRDTHTLTVSSVTADEIRCTVTDSMVDSIFTHPLTVKFRVDSGWDALTATQNGTDIGYRLVLHEGNKYVLADIVPDGGEAVLTRVAPTVVNDPVITGIRGALDDTLYAALTCATTGAELRYTTDGSDPVEASALYGGTLALTAADGATFTLKVKAFKSGLAASAVTSFDVAFDVTVPELVSALASDDVTVLAAFNEALDPATAGDAGNYTIARLTVSAAAVSDDATTVTLTVSGMTTDTDYTLAVTGVKDRGANSVATDTEVEYTYAAPVNEPGLAGYWSFDEPAGTGFALDRTGNGNTAVLYDAGRAPGRNNNALKINSGDYSYLNLGSDKFGIDVFGGFTVAFWFNATRGLVGEMLRRGQYTRPAVVSFYNGKVRTGVRGSVGVKYVNTGTTVEIDTWYHYALAVSGDTAAVYLDGVYEGAVNGYAGPPDFTNGEEWIIGRGFTDGLIDELRMYNRALDGSEILALTGDTTASGIVNPSLQGDMVALRVMPNPVRGTATFMLPVEFAAPVEIYNAAGQLVFHSMAAGANDYSPVYRWNGTDNKGRTVENGVYVIRYGNQTVRVMLAR